jgi:thiol-disulfide isomerase/thioredoxin/Leucine-rich repeat (LRR) protein
MGNMSLKGVGATIVLGVFAAGLTGTLQPLSAQAGDAADGQDRSESAPARTLEFPADYSAGKVYIRDRGLTFDISPLAPDSIPEWELVGEAQGAVTVPAGKGVKLEGQLGPNDERMHALSLLGADALEELAIKGQPVTDDDLAALAHLSGLRHLNLKSTKITDAGLRHLADLKALEVLVLAGTDVTGATFGELAGLTNLTHLELYRASLEDSAAGSLRSFPALKWLSVNRTGLTAAAIPVLATLTQLEGLDIGGLELEDSDLAPLGELSQLHALSLSWLDTTAEGLALLSGLENLRYLDLRSADLAGGGAALAQFPNLEELDVSYAEFADDELSALAGLSNLRKLNLRGTKITGVALARLSGLEHLEELDLGSTKIANEALAALAPIETLKSLNLERTHLDEGALPYLEQLKHVTELDFDETAIPGAENPMVSIGGCVTDVDGNPIAGAAVATSYPQQNSSVHTGANAETDSTGHWEMMVHRYAQDLRFSVKHDDYLSDRFSNSRPSPPWDRLVDGTAAFVMQANRVYCGKVVDESGAPVAGAVVTQQMQWGGLDEYEEGPFVALTAGDGTFELRNIGAEVYQITVLTKDYAPEPVPLPNGDESSPVTVTLKAPNAISGRVTSRDGSPLEGVKVKVSEWRSDVQRPVAATAETDTDGAYELTPLPSEGELRIGYSKKGFFSSSANPVLPVERLPEVSMYRSEDFRGKIVDAGSGEPVTDFEVVLGMTSDWAPGGIHWLGGFTSVDADSDRGTFEATPHVGGLKDDVTFYARVLAPGYCVATSEALPAEELGALVTISMRQAPPVTGIVRTPEGACAAGASLAWVGPDEEAFISNGQFEQNFVASPLVVEQADESGAFDLPSFEEEGLLVTLHETGYAYLPGNELGADMSITLTAWASAKGNVALALAPEEEHRLQVEVEPFEIAGRDDVLHWMYNVSPHVDGSFSIGKLPALPMKIGLSRRWVPSHPVTITPEAGLEHHFAIGDGPGCFTGALDLPEGQAITAIDTRVRFDDRHLMAKAVPATRADDKNAPVYVPTIGADAAFSLEGLPPGEYQLSFTLHANPPQNACGRGTTVAKAETRVTVEDGAAGQSTNLGRIALSTVTHPQPGDIAPDLVAETLDGKDWRLAGKRGKPVLLHFWATWCAPCKASLPKLAEVVKERGQSGDLKVVGLNLDMEKKTALGFVEKEALTWEQAYVGAWSDTNAVTNTWGVSYIPSIWLIDGEGKIVARDIKPEDLDEVLAKI